MKWLNGPPAKMPPLPPDVDIGDLMGHAEAVASKGGRAPAMEYFRANAPALAVDKWGVPLPYSQVDQDRANRLMAILTEPFHRGLALVKSGTIMPEEVRAIHEVYPEVYDDISDLVTQAMLQQGPPFELWAEVAISTWFEKPAPVVYASSKGTKPGRGRAGGGRPTELPTPADRRDLALRSQKG